MVEFSGDKKRRILFYNLVRDPDLKGLCSNIIFFRILGKYFSILTYSNCNIGKIHTFIKIMLSEFNKKYLLNCLNE